VPPTKDITASRKITGTPCTHNVHKLQENGRKTHSRAGHRGDKRVAPLDERGLSKSQEETLSGAQMDDSTLLGMWDWEKSYEKTVKE